MKPKNPINIDIEAIIKRNLFIRLLLTGGYRWVLLAVILALGYFGIGVVMAIITDTLRDFLLSRQIYVYLLAIIACVTAACWYPPILIKVLAATPKAFNIKAEKLSSLTEQWARCVRLPIPFAFGFTVVIVAFGTNFFGVVLRGSPSNPDTIWHTIYQYFLPIICGVMLGGGLEVFLATLWLLRTLFQYDLRLANYRQLISLGDLSTGLTVASLVAVALFMLLVFNQINSASFAVLVLGIIFSFLMFIVPQLSYHNAVIQKKREHLQQIGALYEQHYLTLQQDVVPLDILSQSEEAIGSLKVLEKSINDIPLWLIDMGHISQMLIAILAPMISFILNAI